MFKNTAINNTCSIIIFQVICYINYEKCDVLRRLWAKKGVRHKKRVSRDF